MSSFLQDNIYAIILFLLLLVLVLIALIGIVLVKLLLNSKDQKDSKISAKTPEPIVLKQIQKLSDEVVVEKYVCENHPDIPSIGSCLICEDVFCEQCLIEHEGLYFCKEHFRTFAGNKWKQITDVKTTPNTPEDGLYIYHFKRHLWIDRKKPSFVLTHYKINIEEDFIESFIQLNVLETEAENLLNEIEKFKAKH
jgi:hypothetical protein